MTRPTCRPGELPARRSGRPREPPEGVLTSTTVTIDGPQSPERMAFINEYRAGTTKT